MRLTEDHVVAEIARKVWSPWECRAMAKRIMLHGRMVWEADLLVVKKDTLYADEVEVKLTLSDLKRDAKKTRKFRILSLAYTNKIPTPIRRFWYAMPRKVWEKGVDHVPDWAGVLVFDETSEVLGDGSPRLAFEKVRLPKTLASRSLEPRDLEFVERSNYNKLWKWITEGRS